MVIDLSARITAWKKEEEKKRESARLKRAKSRAKLRGVLIADISPTKKEQDKTMKDSMLAKYPHLHVRRYPRVDGTWKFENICDLRRAANLLSRPMKELYISLEHSQGYLRTPAYEVVVIPPDTKDT
jgi:hypothetical protein